MRPPRLHGRSLVNVIAELEQIGHVRFGRYQLQDALVESDLVANRNGRVSDRVVRFGLVAALHRAVVVLQREQADAGGNQGHGDQQCDQDDCQFANRQLHATGFRSEGGLDNSGAAGVNL